MLGFLEGSYLIYIWNKTDAGCLPEVQPYSGVKEFLDHLSHEKGLQQHHWLDIRLGVSPPVWLLIRIYRKILWIQANLISDLPFQFSDNFSNFLCNSNKSGSFHVVMARNLVRSTLLRLFFCSLFRYTICITRGSNLFHCHEFSYTLILLVKVNESFPILKKPILE